MARSLGFAAAATAAALGLACAAIGRRPERDVTPVTEADLGRLSPAQMGPIQAARADLAAAHDALARARLRLQESHHEDEFARADAAEAEADRRRAEAEAARAREAGDPSLERRAAALQEGARLRREAAEARLEYGRRLVEAREADVRARETLVRRREWELERAKLTALSDAGIPAASKYDPAPYDRRVAQAVRAEEAAKGRARELDRTAADARERWRALVERHEASARETREPR